MGRLKLLGPIVLALSLVLALLSGGCFTTTNSSTTSGATATETVVKPVPEIVKVSATTSGTQSAYYATLDIKVKNTGAEGIVLVQASVTQNGTTSTNEMPVYLMNNETHELKLTFPLVWEGGEFTSDVQAVVP